MQIPSVSGMFQSKLGAVRDKMPAGFADSFENAYASALDDTGDASAESQELTIAPEDAASLSLQATGQTDAESLAGDTAASLASAQSNMASTPRIYYSAASSSSSSASLPLFIPASKAVAYTTAGAAAGLGQQISSYATQFVGLPYVHGGENLQTGVDCSGFTQSVFKHFGVSLPRSANNQSKVGVEVSTDNLKPGDLLFFKTDDYAPVTHVALYIGNGKCVEARGVKWGVVTTKLSGNWQEKRHFVTARRIVGQ